jgi:hypothetical protein
MEVMTERTKEQVYDEEIYPLMAKIIEITKRHKIAMFLHFEIPTPDNPTLSCSTFLGNQDGLDPSNMQAAFYVLTQGKVYEPGVQQFTTPDGTLVFADPKYRAN